MKRMPPDHKQIILANILNVKLCSCTHAVRYSQGSVATDLRGGDNFHLASSAVHFCF